MRVAVAVLVAVFVAAVLSWSGATAASARTLATDGTIIVEN